MRTHVLPGNARRTAMDELTVQALSVSPEAVTAMKAAAERAGPPP